MAGKAHNNQHGVGANSSDEHRTYTIMFGTTGVQKDASPNEASLVKAESQLVDKHVARQLGFVTGSRRLGRCGFWGCMAAALLQPGPWAQVIGTLERN